MIAARFDVQLGRRLDADVDVFRETVDDLVALDSKVPPFNSNFRPSFCKP
jgi:hypothetical protein